MAGAGGGDGTCTNCTARGLSRCFCSTNSTVNSSLDAPVTSPQGTVGLSPQGGLSTALSYKHTGAAQVEEANAVLLPAKIQAARAAAKAARDSRKEGERPLVDLWREASKPRKDNKPSEAIPLQPAGCKLDFPHLFDQWLAARGLEDSLTYDGDRAGWSVYRYVKEPVVESATDWEVAYHGTWWYAVWLILETGIFLESNDLSLGHDFWEPGVYCSPDLDTGLWYARPQILFGDGVYHRVIFELRVDPQQRKRNRKRGGVQWVFPMEAVALHAVLVRSNAPPAKGEERVNEWEPELEAMPVDSLRPDPIVNQRKGPWPPRHDEHPFDLGTNDVPPWMRTQKAAQPSAPAEIAPKQWQDFAWPADWGQAAPAWLQPWLTPTKPVKPAQQPRPVPSNDKYGTHRLGGLYGRWLKEAGAGDNASADETTPDKDSTPAAKKLKSSGPVAWQSLSAR